MTEVVNAAPGLYIPNKTMHTVDSMRELLRPHMDGLTTLFSANLALYRELTEFSTKHQLLYSGYDKDVPHDDPIEDYVVKVLQKSWRFSRVTDNTSILEFAKSKAHRELRTNQGYMEEMKNWAEYLSSPRTHTVQEGIAECRRLMEASQIVCGLNMTSWRNSQRPVSSVEELHACGNTACFAGYIRLSPFFQEHYAFRDTPEPSVKFGDCPDGVITAGGVVAKILGISHLLAARMIYADRGDYTRPDGTHSLYRVKWDNVVTDNILEILDLIEQGKTLEEILNRP